MHSWIHSPVSSELAALPERSPARKADSVENGEIERIIERARLGERAALGLLYDRFSPEVYRFLFRQCGDASLAEDLTADVFLRLLDAIEGERGWRQSFSGWLFRIARNRLHDHYRSRGRRTEVELPAAGWSDEGSQDPEGQAAQDAMIQDLGRAMASLRPKQAEVLHLRFGEGWSHRRVAERMGMSETAVKVTQHRALEAIRRRLAHVIEETRA
jgi:RNA polymerase sigma-70 factor (ECF subfamily)